MHQFLLHKQQTASPLLSVRTPRISPIPCYYVYFLRHLSVFSCKIFYGQPLQQKF
jgi:hypothetical protein